MNDRAFTDKAEWGDGPWQSEPDELAFSYGDVACRIVRNPRLGGLCGYVGVPPSHPWYGKGYDELDARTDVHGGLTFAGEFGEGAAITGRDHQRGHGWTYATRTDDRLWWVGFDCMHAGDLTPALDAFERSKGFDPILGGTYRELGYVRRAVEDLARQAIAQA